MVNEFNVIVVMNEAMIKLLKDKNAQFDNNLKIKKMLEDEAIFFKISKSDAYQILKNVGVKQESLENVYQKLISSDVFYDLLNRGKIKEDDENLIVKDKIYNSNDLFKRKN